MRLLHVRPLQINPGPADGDIQLTKDRGFWWLFETDDEDVPIVSLQYDLAGRKAGHLARTRLPSSTGSRLDSPTRQDKHRKKY